LFERRHINSSGYKVRLADGRIDLVKIAEMKKIVKDVKDARVSDPQRGVKERNEALQRQQVRKALENFL
jgi:hypothetical protein